LSTITSGVSWWSSSNDSFSEQIHNFTSLPFLFFSFLSMVTYWVVIMSRLQTPRVTKCKSPQKGGLNTHHSFLQWILSNCVKKNTKQGITNTLALPINKMLCTSTYGVHTLNTKTICSNLNTFTKETSSPNVKLVVIR